MAEKIKVYDEQVKPTWGFWAFFIGFGFFTIVAIVFTIMNCIHKQKKIAKKIEVQFSTKTTAFPGSGLKNSGQISDFQSSIERTN